MWWSGGEGRVHTSGSPQLCFLRTETFKALSILNDSYQHVFDKERLKRQPVEIRWFGQSRDLPPLFDGCDEVRTREHREQAVAVGRRRLVTGARRVTLIGWPAAVHGLPVNKRKGGVSAMVRINFEMWVCMVKFIAWCLKTKQHNSKFVKWIHFSLKHFQSWLNNSFYCAVL